MLHFNDVMNLRLGFDSNDAGQNQRKENDPDDRGSDFEFGHARLQNLFPWSPDLGNRFNLLLEH
jgi:hypothetical protein